MTRKKRRNKTRYYLIVSLLSLIAIILVFVNVNLWRERGEAEERLESIKEDLQLAEDRKEEFKEEIEKRKTEEEIERIAREQLLLRREGENVIVISREEDEETMDSTAKEEDEERKEAEERSILDEFVEFFSF